MKWSIQDILRKNRLFSKVTRTRGKLHYADRFTHTHTCPHHSGLQSWVLWLTVCAGPSVLQWHKVQLGSRDLVFLAVYVWAWEDRMACWFFFPKQLWHLPVDQGKNRKHSQILQPHTNNSSTSPSPGQDSGSVILSGSRGMHFKGPGEMQGLVWAFRTGAQRRPANSHCFGPPPLRWQHLSTKASGLSLGSFPHQSRCLLHF